jgi:glutaredoxin
MLRREKYGTTRAAAIELRTAERMISAPASCRIVMHPASGYFWTIVRMRWHLGVALALVASTTLSAEFRRTLPPPRTVPAVQYNTPANATGPHVELFVASWCPHCRALESELSARGVSFTRYDIERDPQAKQRYVQLGRPGVPVTRVGTQVIVGNRLNAILAALGRRP